MRDNRLLLDDSFLSENSILDFYKSTGNGGQKKNKTSSAVRLIHKSTKIEATSGNRRSQKENRTIALWQLKLNIATKIRNKFISFPEKFNFAMNERNPQFPFFVGLILDLLFEENFHLANAAKRINFSTAQLIKILQKHKFMWKKYQENKMQNRDEN